MIYKFLKWFATVGITFFYKNIFIQFDPEIPKKHPIIYASNHPSGFYESLILSTISKYAPIFLVRADYISIKGLKWLFKIVKLYPVYRQTEGLKNVSKNKAVFEDLYTELKINTPVCIYPEGTTRFNYKIRAIKKGVSRLAIGAKKSGLNDVKIIPIAFNFVEPVKFRSNLYIYSKGSMNIDNFDNSDLDNPAILRTLTSDIENEMRNVCIELNSKEQHDTFKKLQQVLINDEGKKMKFSSYNWNSFIPEKMNVLTKKINELDDKSFTIIENKTKEYFNLLQDNKTNDKAVISKRNSLLSTIELILGYPIYILSLIVNAIPILFALYIQKTKIRQYEYKTVVTVLIAQFTYIFYLLIILTISISIFSIKGFVILILPFLAWFALKYYDFKQDFIANKNFQHSSNKNLLIKMRQEIRNQIL